MRNQAYFIRGAAPDTPGFTAVGPESLYFGAACTAPAIPAPESTLEAHPCVALSSAQVLSEWKTSTQPCNDSSLNGIYPLTGCLTPGVHFSPTSAPPLRPPHFGPPTSAPHFGPVVQRTTSRFGSQLSNCLVFGVWVTHFGPSHFGPVPLRPALRPATSHPIPLKPTTIQSKRSQAALNSCPLRPQTEAQKPALFKCLSSRTTPPMLS
jgi:hypothetical protein